MTVPEIRDIRWYDSIAIVLIITIAVMLALNMKAYLDKAEVPQNPLSYVVPQEVVGPSVIPVGGTLSVKRVKCNSSGTPIAIQSQGSFYRRVDPAGLYVASQPAGNTIIINADTCDEAVFTGPLPSTVTPGVWVRQGIDCVVDQLTRWCASWVTEQFTVVP